MFEIEKTRELYHRIILESKGEYNSIIASNDIVARLESLPEYMFVAFNTAKLDENTLDENKYKVGNLGHRFDVYVDRKSNKSYCKLVKTKTVIENSLSVDI